MGAELIFELSRIVEASPRRVFEAMTDPEQVTLDAKVGGGYRIAMQPPEGELFHLAGEYVEVQPPTRLAYTFRWEPPDLDDRETVVRLALHARDGATVVALIQGRFATEARRELHRAGWTETFARLPATLHRPDRSRPGADRQASYCCGRPNSTTPAVAVFDTSWVPFEGRRSLLLTTAAPNTRQGRSLQTPSLYREPLPFPILIGPSWSWGPSHSRRPYDPRVSCCLLICLPISRKPRPRP